MQPKLCFEGFLTRWWRFVAKGCDENRSIFMFAFVRHALERSPSKPRNAHVDREMIIHHKIHIHPFLCTHPRSKRDKMKERKNIILNIRHKTHPSMCGIEEWLNTIANSSLNTHRSCPKSKPIPLFPWIWPQSEFKIRKLVQLINGFLQQRITQNRSNTWNQTHSLQADISQIGTRLLPENQPGNAHRALVHDPHHYEWGA